MGVCCSGSKNKAGCPGLSDQPNLERWEKYQTLCREHDKLPRVHRAEEAILNTMPISYHRLDVPTKLDVKRRCGLCWQHGRCCGYHPEFSEWPIHTVIVGEEHNDRLPVVLVHGFMMGAACFFKWYPMLSQDRKVYAIDVIGMGGSGQPPFGAASIDAQKAEDLLVEPFVQWADKVGLSEFILLGHSFGGYVCSAWATRDPGRIKHLGLLSPLLGWTDQRIDAVAHKKDASWQRRVVVATIESAWSHHITPQMICRWIPGAERYFQKNAEMRVGRGGKLTEGECKLMAEYIVATMVTPPSLEAAATVCFEPFCKPVELAAGTIKERLRNLSMPLFCIYGDRDWMDKATNEEVPNCKFYVLTDSGHHLYFDNPEELTSAVKSQIDASGT